MLFISKRIYEKSARFTSFTIVTTIGRKMSYYFFNNIGFQILYIKNVIVKLTAYFEEGKFIPNSAESIANIT